MTLVTSDRGFRNRAARLNVAFRGLAYKRFRGGRFWRKRRRAFDADAWLRKREVGGLKKPGDVRRLPIE